MKTPSKKSRTKTVTVKKKSVVKKPVTVQLTEADVLRVSKNAIIILEIDKIKERFFSAEWNDREKIIK